jgi:hypothetical protein
MDKYQQPTTIKREAWSSEGIRPTPPRYRTCNLRSQASRKQFRARFWICQPATSWADPLAALVEMERGNLFTLSLGNVQPDDIIVIRFAYL